jgi:Uma2 family endonuclease
MVIRERRYTLDDLRALEQLPENANKTFELLNGELYEMPTPENVHNFVVAVLLAHLFMFGKANNLGMAFGDNTSYTLPNGDELIPDVSFIAAERLPKPMPKKFFFAPDLAVEVFSPSNREREMLERVQSFLASGTRIVWVVYPVTRVVDVYRSSADGSLTLRTIPFEGALDGEDVLPGFSLPVKDIFPTE